jgi:hypothetical protein
MWLKCCQCGKQFETTGELAEQTRAFYAAQKNHAPDKEGGVCDECWEKSTRNPITPPAGRWNWNPIEAARGTAPWIQREPI